MKRTLATIGAVVILSMPLTAHAEEVPADVRAIAEELGGQYGICPELIEAVCYQESRFTPTAIGANGQYIGMMQVNPTIHAARMQRLGVTDLTDLYGGMLVGTDYLAELCEQYEDIGAVLMVYSGSGKALRNYEATGQMTGYVKQVLDRAARYERMNGK